MARTSHGNRGRDRDRTRLPARPRRFAAAIGLAAAVFLLVLPAAASAALKFSRGVPDLDVGTAPVSIAIDDFNGDDDPDLAVANQISNNVSVLIGDGTGGFGAATNISVGDSPRSIAAGLFNADGDPDLAVANGNDDNVTVLLGGAGGTFAEVAGSPLAAGTNATPESVAVGDFDGDNDTDLATANSGTNDVSILPGNGNGTFGGLSSLDLPVSNSMPHSIAVGDLNEDGDPDLVTANRLIPGTVSVLLGEGGH